MPRDRRHVAGLGRHQAVDGAFAEQLGLLGRGLCGGVRHPRPGILADARHQARQHADRAGPQHGAPVARDFAKTRPDRIAHFQEFALHRIGQPGQHFGKTERPDERRDECNTAGERGKSEGESIVRIDSLLSDLRDEETERSHQPAFERIVADERPRHRYAEQGEPEELLGAEGQRDVGQHRRERRKAHHAEKRAAKRARRGDADRASGFAAQRKGVAVRARCCVRGGPRNVEQDR